MSKPLLAQEGLQNWKTRWNGNLFSPMQTTASSSNIKEALLSGDVGRRQAKTWLSVCCQESWQIFFLPSGTISLQRRGKLVILQSYLLQLCSWWRKPFPVGTGAHTLFLRSGVTWVLYILFFSFAHIGPELFIFSTPEAFWDVELWEKQQQDLVSPGTFDRHRGCFWTRSVFLEVDIQRILYSSHWQ